MEGKSHTHLQRVWFHVCILYPSSACQEAMGGGTHSCLQMTFTHALGLPQGLDVEGWEKP